MNLRPGHFAYTYKEDRVNSIQQLIHQDFCRQISSLPSTDRNLGKTYSKIIEGINSLSKNEILGLYNEVISRSFCPSYSHYTK